MRYSILVRRHFHDFSKQHDQLQTKITVISATNDSPPGGINWSNRANGMADPSHFRKIGASDLAVMANMPLSRIKNLRIWPQSRNLRCPVSAGSLLFTHFRSLLLKPKKARSYQLAPTKP